MGAIGTAPELARALAGIGGGAQAEKLEELRDKEKSTDLFLAFCGHFSAGKSTLINRLCGHRLLPSGPIPTSANIVRIRNGESSARIYRRGPDRGLAAERLPLEELEEACQDGGAVETVEIRYPVPLLGDSIVLLDTPGIDSTDDAHQAATQSAMHLADVVFYVMDYNYVQSEINFTFAKKLQEAGKPLYLIVNMIDKHRERELSFEAYRNGVREAFRNWHIEPAGILFLSLREPAFPGNEWGKLPVLIRELGKAGASLKARNLARTAQHLIHEALAEWREGRELEKALYLEAGGGSEALEAAKAEAERLERRESELLGASERELVRWKKELQSLMENANLTPAVTRDLAASYLETRKPGFKVGFLARAAKTEEERARRLEAFRKDLEEQFRAHLLWHAADYIKKAGALLGITGETFLREVTEGLELSIQGEWLAGQVHAGPDFTGEYVLNYCRQVASGLKDECRRSCWTLLDLLAERVKVRSAEELAQILERKKDSAVRLAAWDGLKRMEREEAEKERELLGLAASILEAPGAEAKLPDPRELAAEAGAGEGGAAAGEAGPSEGRAAKAAALGAYQRRGAALDEAEAAAVAAAPGDRLKRTAERLSAGAQLLEGLPGTEPVIRSLRDKAQKLSGNRFTLALFGAFSAGKSSFSNALMGEPVLPVSPNPTTAAITTILPPEERYPHGTVRVHLKSAKEIKEEIVYSLRAIGLDVAENERSSEEALLNRIRRLTPEGITPAGKPHLTFLKAVEKGWSDISGSLGQVLTAERELFRSYVAEESKSCFATLVELYQETPLSAHGIVLVDTPGADSINARHTGVAFNYIKNADAILFVTYYNHAFSQADREFLVQLGRVKDAMQLDKMFFIVNAADLAADEAELAGVLRHVEDNLLRFGIRNPRLFPVSSLMAMEGKMAGDREKTANSGISGFEAAFRRFAETELAGLASQGAEQELARASRLLGQWLEAAQEDEGARARKRAALQEAGALALERGVLRWEASDASELRKELEEQLYYVKQRTGFRFPELFRTAFNPAALREDAGDLKRAFKASWQDLIRMLGVYISQETLAVSLRLEQYLNRQLGAKWEQVQTELRGLLDGYGEALPEPSSYPTPEVREEPEAGEPEVKWLLGFYRNGRHFFEGEGRSALQNALQERLAGPIDRYVRQHAESFAEAYQAHAEASVAALSVKLEESVRLHKGGLEAALDQGLPTHLLVERKDRLDALLAE